jgi:hypothetical protein
MNKCKNLKIAYLLDSCGLGNASKKFELGVGVSLPIAVQNSDDEAVSECAQTPKQFTPEM